MHVPLQTGFKNISSTETALIKLQNGILHTLDCHKCVVLLLLDVCGIWHCQPPSFTWKDVIHFGGKNQVLKWFRSYLLDRKQFVTVDRVKSAVKGLCFGQGSVLGPILYLLYMLPLGDIIKHHNLDFTFMLMILSSTWPLSLMQPNKLAQ